MKPDIGLAKHYGTVVNRSEVFWYRLQGREAFHLKVSREMYSTMSSCSYYIMVRHIISWCVVMAVAKVF